MIIYVPVDAPQIFKMISHSTQPISSTFFLTCNVIKGARSLHFQWFKDDLQLENTTMTNDKQIMIESKYQMSHLTIPEIKVDHAGNYSCVSTNQFGSDTQWTVLQVLGLFKLCVC